jgi:hypothetical protein
MPRLEKRIKQLMTAALRKAPCISPVNGSAGSKTRMSNAKPALRRMPAHMETEKHYQNNAVFI